MIFKNLMRRKGRTLLTVLGISIGVMSIIALGALADGLEAGYSSVLSGANADFVLTEPDSFDIIMSSVDERIGEELAVMPEVSAVSALIQGLVMTDDSPYFFVFGYPEGSFVLDRFQIVEGYPLGSREAEAMRGVPLILGSASAESLKKEVGDTIRLSERSFRVVGIFETGDAFEEGGAVLELKDAQELLGMPRQVSLYYIQLKDPSQADRLRTRVERLYPELSISAAEELEQSEGMAGSLKGMVIGVAAMAILIGGVSMMNAQLMSVFERTREIGVLRAVGWRSWRVLLMILGESIVVSILGGIVGVGLAWLTLFAAAGQLSAFGATTHIRAELLIQSFVVVFVLGLVGGFYPAYRASQLQPIEALRYEGGTAGNNASRLPIGGMAIQNLWRRKGRTALTLAMIGLTIGSIMMMNSITLGMMGMMTDFIGGAEVMVRQAGAADTSVAFIDERIGDRIASMPEVENVSGLLFTATISEETGMFLLQGFSPGEEAIQRFRVIDGERIFSNRQIMMGRSMAEAQNIGVGDTISLGDTRFSVVGIFESGTAWEEMGGIITLRDAQNFAGRQRKVTFFIVDLTDPNTAESVVEQINAQFPEAHASLAGEFAEQLPDMEAMEGMSGGISVLALLVGGVGMMNAMLMAVLERTREIGVLRALGWRRRAILSLIIRESFSLGILGAIIGTAFALISAFLIKQIPTYGDIMPFIWGATVFISAITVALLLGVIGGLYPAFRATRMQPIEALRYE